MTESELAIWLTEHMKENPLCGIKVFYQLGDWNISGYIPIPTWGIVEIDFQLDTCHTFKGFDRIHDSIIKFDAEKSHCYISIGKLTEIIDKYLKPFEEFLQKIPNKN